MGTQQKIGILFSGIRSHQSDERYHHSSGKAVALSSWQIVKVPFFFSKRLRWNQGQTIKKKKKIKGTYSLYVLNLKKKKPQFLQFIENIIFLYLFPIT